jgi:hypothetical protein
MTAFTAMEPHTTAARQDYQSSTRQAAARKQVDHKLKRLLKLSLWRIESAGASTCAELQLCCCCWQLVLWWHMHKAQMEFAQGSTRASSESCPATGCLQQAAAAAFQLGSQQRQAGHCVSRVVTWWPA